MIKQNCKVCGKKFYIYPYVLKRGRGKYCSKECVYKARRTKVKRICKNCGKEFYVWAAKIKEGGGKYCSKKCSDESHMFRIKRTCQNCGKIFQVVPSRIKLGGGKYCSLKCMGIAYKERKFTEETRRKLSESRVKYLSSSKSKGKGKTYDTKIELAFEAQLRANEIKYLKQYNAEGIACVDFFIPEYKIIVECDGDYWHSKEDHKQRDVDKTFRLRFKGYKIF